MSQRDRVSAAAWLVVRNAHTAEDIFQNVALKAMTKGVQFESGGALYVMGVHHRPARRHRLATPPKECAGSASTKRSSSYWSRSGRMKRLARPVARSQALRDCLEDLPAKSRDLLKRRYFDGHACEAVAEQLGARLDAIYKRLSRLHQALKKCIETKLEQPAG